MEIIKNAWIDILVTAVIAAAVFLDVEVLMWLVYVYTPIMLILKVVTFARRHKPSKFKPQDAGVPVAVFHVLYAANVLILAYASMEIDQKWTWVAACWAAIWVLSAVTGRGKAVKKPLSDEN